MLQMCHNNCYALSSEAERMVDSIIKEKVDNKGEQFVNGRFVRNLYEDLVMNHARRVSKIKTPTKEELMTIEIEDVE